MRGRKQPRGTTVDIEEAIKLSELEDKAKAEDMRLMAMEKVRETKKRKSTEADDVSKGKGKKGRRSGAETLEFMREKMAKDQELKREEIELQRDEEKKMQEQHATLLQQMQLQQVNQSNQMKEVVSAFIQQGQSQSQTMLSIVKKLMKK